MVRAVRQLGHSKPVLSGHLRELESRALPLRPTTLIRFFKSIRFLPNEYEAKYFRPH